MGVGGREAEEEAAAAEVGGDVGAAVAVTGERAEAESREGDTLEMGAMVEAEEVAACGLDIIII